MLTIQINYKLLNLKKILIGLYKNVLKSSRKLTTFIQIVLNLFLYTYNINIHPCLLIAFVIPNMSQICFCVYQKYLKSTFKPFEFVFLSCVKSQGYFVLKKLMWNVQIKAFWYTKTIIHILFRKKMLDLIAKFANIYLLVC